MRAVKLFRLAAASWALAAAVFLPIHVDAETVAPQTFTMGTTLVTSAEGEVLEPGFPFTCIVYGPNAAEAVRATLVGPDGVSTAAASFFPFAKDAGEGPIRVAILAVPNNAKSGVSTVRAYAADGSIIAEIALLVLKRAFISDTILLDAKNTAIRTVSDPKKTAEAEELWKILSRFDPTAYWSTEAFTLPLDSTRRTSGFGDRRLYRYSTGAEETSVHAGIDFGVPVGTPVRSTAAGKIVLVRERIITGKSVVIEHLPGVFSQYYHLSRTDVAEGTIIPAGTVIGLSGSSGLSTGPHLHWELRVGGEAADPDALVARRLLDKDFVLSKIKGSSAPD